MADWNRSDHVVLFDVDGTLTESRQLIKPEMETLLLEKLKAKVKVGLVSGSDLKKLAEQMGGEDVIHKFDYVFPENGLVAYQDGNLIDKMDISKHMGEEKLQKFINFCLHYMADLSLPIKRGTFIEFRNGLINICPVGRSCSQEQRIQFHELDLEKGIRRKFVEVLNEKFPENSFGLHFAIGGQISIDAFPIGWDKRFCLRHIENHAFKEIHFYGDRTEEGGNDYQLYADPRTIGHAVTSPDDTMGQLKEHFQL